MGLYYKSHIDRLTRETKERFDRLMAALAPGSVCMRNNKEVVPMDSSRLRMAIDDFKSVLAEIRKIK